MIEIPFVKGHGAKNDFLLTWRAEAPEENLLSAAAAAICDRNSGVGADGWLLVAAASGGEPARIRLFNPDGGEVEMSGNGTRCAAAFLIDAGAAGPDMTIRTGGGDKRLQLQARDGLRFSFSMNMGAPRILEGGLYRLLPLSAGERECTILWVGNPQCAVFVEDFHFDWRGLGAEIERHPAFPNRTNVSFVRVLDAHRLEVRFFERGAGFTMSSGTGSTGAVAAAALAQLGGQPEDTTLGASLADPFMFQDYYRDRAPDYLGKEFGPQFAKAVEQLTPGSWQGPIESGFGWHLVFVDTVIPGHRAITTWDEFREYAAFTQEFVDFARAAMKAQKSVDQAAAEYKVPAKYKGYVATVDPQLLTPAALLKIAYDELRK